MSQRLIPIRYSMRRSCGTASLRSAIMTCTATEHSTASTTEGNSSRQAVARGLDDFRPPCVATSASEATRCSRSVRAGPGLVEPHQPGIAGHVGSHDRRQPCGRSGLAPATMRAFPLRANLYDEFKTQRQWKCPHPDSSSTRIRVGAALDRRTFPSRLELLADRPASGFVCRWRRRWR